jgi:plastocyanin
MRNLFKLTGLLIALTILLSACAGSNTSSDSNSPQTVATGRSLEYTLTTGMVDGKMVFIGVGGGIDGVQNPVLIAHTGDTVKVTLTNGDGVEHDIAFPDFDAASERISSKGSSTTLTFLVDQGGVFSYYCTLPGHREAGMKGEFKVSGDSLASEEDPAPAVSGQYVVASGPVVVTGEAASGADIVRDPTGPARASGNS